MNALTKMRSVGGSLMVTVPRKLVEAKSLVEGDLVEIEVNKIKKSGFGMLKGIGRFSKEDELNTEL